MKDHFFNIKCVVTWKSFSKNEKRRERNEETKIGKSLVDLQKMTSILSDTGKNREVGFKSNHNFYFLLNLKT